MKLLKKLPTVVAIILATGPFLWFAMGTANAAEPAEVEILWEAVAPGGGPPLRAPACTHSVPLH